MLAAAACTLPSITPGMLLRLSRRVDSMQLKACPIDPQEHRTKERDS